MDAPKPRKLPRTPSPKGQRRRTGYVYEHLYAWHDPGSISSDRWTQPGPHWESKESKERIHSLIAVSGLLKRLERLDARAATREELERFHTAAYVDSVRELSAGAGGETGEDAHIGPGGFEVAALSCGGVLAALEAVHRGEVANAYCLVRPPGHHAESARGMGFCVFNNVVVAALHAKAALGYERVAVVDYDVHHGNGTESAFLHDASTLFVSLHQAGNYPPGRGAVLSLPDAAADADAAASINVPLPPGSGVGAYEAAMDFVVMPALARHCPDLILVSSGFDAAYCDPLAAMMLPSTSFASIAAKLVVAAEELCGGRVVFAHEGGYSQEYAPFCGVAVVEQLVGLEGPSPVEDAYLDEVLGWGYQELQPEQLRVVAEACAAAGLPAPVAASAPAPAPAPNLGPGPGLAPAPAVGRAPAEVALGARDAEALARVSAILAEDGVDASAVLSRLK